MYAAYLYLLHAIDAAGQPRTSAQPGAHDEGLLPLRPVPVLPVGTEPLLPAHLSSRRSQALPGASVLAR